MLACSLLDLYAESGTPGSRNHCQAHVAIGRLCLPVGPNQPLESPLWRVPERSHPARTRLGYSGIYSRASSRGDAMNKPTDRTGLDDGPTPAEAKAARRKAILCERAKRELGPMNYVPPGTNSPTPGTNPHAGDTMPLLRETIRRVEALEAAILAIGAKLGVL